MYRMISFLKGAAVGAGIMYFFDPVVGNRRRALVRDQFNHFMNKTCRVADARFRDMQNRLHGTIAEARSSLQHDQPSDKVLCDRVRSTLGRHTARPRAVEVEARNGIVILSGPALASEAEGLCAAVRSVRGVRGVENHLDLHETLGDISALQGASPS